MSRFGGICVLWILKEVLPRVKTAVRLSLACIAWRFLSGETAITNPKVVRSLGERQRRFT